MINQNEVKSIFNYQDGNLIRRVDAAPNARKGDMAGRVDSSGYLQTAIRKKRYFNHAIVWLYHHGCIPKEIDHINQNKLDNRLENLRDVSHAENMANTGKRKNAKSGIPGVAWHKNKNRWEAYISVNKRISYLGAFNEFEEAICHRYAAEQCLGRFIYKSEAEEYVKNNIINK